MTHLPILFPMETSLDEKLSNMLKDFLKDIERKINNKENINNIEENFKSAFEKLKLNIEFDKEYNPPVVTNKNPVTNSRLGYYIFETRDYRFVVQGNHEMLFIYSGGGINISNPPTGYFNKHLYIRVSYEQSLSPQEKENIIFQQIEKQKKVINTCIKDQINVIDSFINKNLITLEKKYQDILSKKLQAESFENSLKNKLSEL